MNRSTMGVEGRRTKIQVRGRFNIVHRKQKEGEMKKGG